MMAIDINCPTCQLEVDASPSYSMPVKFTSLCPLGVPKMLAVSSQFLGTALSLIPFSEVVVTLNAILGSNPCTGSNFTLRSTCDAMTCASIIAKCFPMQMRDPPPNGMKAISCGSPNSASPSGSHLSGQNSIGLSQYFSLWWTDQTSGVTIVPFRIKDLDPSRTVSRVQMRLRMATGGHMRSASLKHAVRKGRLELSTAGVSSCPLSIRSSASLMHLSIISGRDARL
mmetsp:Transcript_36061/g.85569  ORF Transcript_36061/g.85569 Transcript_36061/m.85569 type:complete len:227 (+) Transcript_36061:114-794(+)